MAPEQRGPTTLGDELDNIGPRIYAALVSSHGNDPDYLGNVMASLGDRATYCLYCKFHKRGECPGCAVLLFVLTKLENYMDRFNGEQQHQQPVAEVAAP